MCFNIKIDQKNSSYQIELHPDRQPGRLQLLEQIENIIHRDLKYDPTANDAFSVKDGKNPKEFLIARAHELKDPQGILPTGVSLNGVYQQKVMRVYSRIFAPQVIPEIPLDCLAIILQLASLGTLGKVACVDKRWETAVQERRSQLAHEFGCPSLDIEESEKYLKELCLLVRNLPKNLLGNNIQQEDGIPDTIELLRKLSYASNREIYQILKHSIGFWRNRATVDQLTILSNFFLHVSKHPPIAEKDIREELTDELLYQTDVKIKDEKHCAIAKLLLRLGADSRGFSNKEITPLYSALRDNNAPLVKLLIQYRAADGNCNKAISYALEKGNVEVVICMMEEILKTKNLHDQYKDFFDGIMYYALQFNRCSVISFLLDKGFPIDSFIFTDPLLTHAMINGHEEALRLVLERGAKDLNQSPLHRALRTFSISAAKANRIVRLVLAHRADVNATDAQGNTSLHLAVQIAKKEEHPGVMLNLLLQKSVKLDVQNMDGNTALHLAALHRQFDLMIELIKQGAKPSLKNNQGLTPLQLLPPLLANSPVSLGIITESLQKAELKAKISSLTEKSAS